MKVPSSTTVSCPSPWRNGSKGFICPAVLTELPRTNNALSGQWQTVWASLIATLYKLVFMAGSKINNKLSTITNRTTPTLPKPFSKVFTQLKETPKPSYLY
jgi:hypothetical protein